MLSFLEESGWDKPIFKILSKNDSGKSDSNQVGFVFPKDLRIYLPSLDTSTVDSSNPTVDEALEADLYLDTKFLGAKTVRYQYQTWKGKRSPESRITKFSKLRKHSSKGDLIIMQRAIDSLHHFRLIVLRKGTPAFKEIKKLRTSGKWGVLFPGEKPMTRSKYTSALAHFDEKPTTAFSTSADVQRSYSSGTRVARDKAFRDKLLEEYGGRCAVSGISLRTPDDAYGIEAAHIIPLSKGGPDELRNGILLSRNLHWAFDKGLFGINDNRRVIIPETVKEFSENSYLDQFEGQQISEARTVECKAHPEAFKWHRDKILRQHSKE